MKWVKDATENFFLWALETMTIHPHRQVLLVPLLHDEREKVKLVLLVAGGEDGEDGVPALDQALLDGRVLGLKKNQLLIEAFN